MHSQSIPIRYYRHQNTREDVTITSVENKNRTFYWKRTHY